MRADGSFEVGYGFRMGAFLNECRGLAESIEKSSDETSKRTRMAAAAEKGRCRRAWWRMQSTAEELGEEITYCRTVLQSFRASSANLESTMLHHLDENADDLIDLH